MNNIKNDAFKHKNGAAQYTHMKVGRKKKAISLIIRQRVTSNTVPMTPLK